MRRWLPLLIGVGWATIATAAPLPLPQGARWLVAAPEAGRFAWDAFALLEAAGRQSSAVSPRSLGMQLERSFALPITDSSRLAAAGVDPSQPWLVFARGDATYLAAGVRDPVPLAALLDEWAAKRGLKRDEEKLKAPLGTVVTFARSAGARPVTGYLIARGRLVLLVTPGDRKAGLDEAWRACEEAAPISPPVDGTLLVWLGTGVPFQDGWLGFTARPNGIDLKGVARKVEPGWLVRDTARSGWLQALAGGTESLPGDAPGRVRLNAGPRMTAAMIDSIVATGAADPPLEKWIQGLASLGPGPLEAMAQSVDVAAIQSGASGDLRRDLLRVTRPQIRLEERPAAAVRKKVDAAAAVLCKPRRESDDVVASQCPETPLTVSGARATLSVTWGRSPNDFELPVPKAATPILGCGGGGTPVASARLDLAAVFRGSRSIGFLEALTNDALAGLYAFVTQYGALMKASRPAVALACQERDGRTTVEGQWRFTPR